MKKYLLLILVAILLVGNSLSVFAEYNAYDALGTNKLRVATKVQVGGMWGENWNTKDYKVATSISKNQFVITLYPSRDEAWNYYCKITLKDFTLPDKKSKQTHKKEKNDFVYNADIEFYYNVEYPSVEECFANYGGFAVNSKDKTAKRRNVEGRVHFNPYFFTAGDNFGEDDDEKMIMNFVIDEVVCCVYFFDHLEFPKK
jgi:hypothetical protein